MKIQKSVIFVKKNLKNKYLKDKKYCKVRDHCHYAVEYRSAAHTACNLNIVCLKKIPIVFLNGSHYDYHFFIRVSRRM